ncbi:MAG: Uma2 family endonuclease, partial [Leptolyngbya sp. Prado105]|nr:Uma2 family endonuclease [Leptolyngbya sp. Prado105]
MAARLFTPEEYLDLEADAEFRSHYDAGLITPKSSGTVHHNLICGNCCCLLNQALRQQSYELFVIDIKVWIPQFKKVRYPNLMVIFGKPEFYKNYKTAIANPQVIIEVLPDSAAKLDRKDKFKLYQSIPTFQEYLLIDQNQIAIDHFYKTKPKQWQIDQFDAQDTQIHLKSVDVTLSIAEIYEKVTFWN